jgi:transposase
MEMFGKVRRMHLRDQLLLHEISERTGQSRTTLRKWLRKPKAEVVAPPRYRRAEAPNQLSPYYATLEQALKAGAHRIPTHAGRNYIGGAGADTAVRPQRPGRHACDPGCRQSLS